MQAQRFLDRIKKEDARQQQNNKDARQQRNNKEAQQQKNNEDAWQHARSSNAHNKNQNNNVDIGLVESPFQHTCLKHLQDSVVNDN